VAGCLGHQHGLLLAQCISELQVAREMYHPRNQPEEDGKYVDHRRRSLGFCVLRTLDSHVGVFVRAV